MASYKNQAGYMARRDISNHLKIIHPELSKPNSYEQWLVKGEYLFNKEQRNLNRLLGVHKVNMSRH